MLKTRICPTSAVAVNITFIILLCIYLHLHKQVKEHINTPFFIDDYYQQFKMALFYSDTFTQAFVFVFMCVVFVHIVYNLALCITGTVDATTGYCSG